MQEEVTLVAVYGTLRQGFGNHRLIQQEPIAELSIMGYRMQSLGGFPIVKSTGNEEDVVTVEVHAVNAKKLAACDRLEGHPDWYERKVVGQVSGALIEGAEADEVYPLWMYLMPDDQYVDHPHVPSGDWKVHTGRNEEDEDE